MPTPRKSAEIDLMFDDGPLSGRWLEVSGSGQVHPQVVRNMGFDPERVKTVIEGEINKEGKKNETAKGSGSESVIASGRADVDGREGGDQDSERRASTGDDDQIGGPKSAGHGAEGKPGQSDSPSDRETEKKSKRK